MEAHNFNVDALGSALCAIETSDCRAVGANNVFDDVNEQEKDILDYFVEDDLDFIDNDWDCLDVDAAGIATGVDAATSLLPSSADWEHLHVEPTTLASQ